MCMHRYVFLVEARLVEDVQKCCRVLEASCSCPLVSAATLVPSQQLHVDPGGSKSEAEITSAFNPGPGCTGRGGQKKSTFKGHL